MVSSTDPAETLMADFNWRTVLVSLMSTVKAGPLGMMQLHRIWRVAILGSSGSWEGLGGEVPPAIHDGDVTSLLLHCSRPISTARDTK